MRSDCWQFRRNSSRHRSTDLNRRGSKCDTRFASKCFDSKNTSVGPHRWRMHGIDCSRTQCFIDERKISFDTARDHKNRTWTFFHDRTRRNGAVHHGHHHIHQNQIGFICFAFLNRISSVNCHPSNRCARNLGEGVAENFLRYSKIIYNCKPHQTAAPMRSAMVCRNDWS